MQQILRCFFAAVNAVRNSYTVIGVARERKTGKLLQVVFYALDSFEMADMVLRHRTRVAVNAANDRLSSNSQ